MPTTERTESGAGSGRARASVLTSAVLPAVAAVAWVHVVWTALTDDMAAWTW